MTTAAATTPTPPQDVMTMNTLTTPLEASVHVSASSTMQNAGNKRGKDNSNNNGKQQTAKKQVVIANEDAYHRMNFLFQAAHLALNQSNPKLARFYCATLKKIASRKVLRL